MGAELIYRQAAKDAIHKQLSTLDLFESRFNVEIDAIPAVDAVEVVRCKDCKWWNQAGCAISIVDDSDKPTANDFCSFGERRTNG